MDVEEMKLRTKQFAINVAKLIEKLPQTLINRTCSAQLIRCSSSVAANYRASCRAKSRPDFINKRKIVEEELDESLFFLEMLENFNGLFSEEIKVIHSDGEILLKIIVASIIATR